MVVAAQTQNAPAVASPIAAVTALGQVSAPVNAPLGVQTVLPQSASKLQTARTTASVQPASLGTPGPASDVGAEYGPSLGSITAAAIQRRCQADQLNCQ